MDYGLAYGQLHARKPKWFSGYSILDCIDELVAAIDECKPDRLLDYGCGKGYQYLKHRVHERWGGLLPYCYDPGVIQLAERPEGTFSGVICTDVMEHIEEADVDRVLADVLGFAGKGGFVFFNIACRPARSKKLPDGRNVHVTVRPPEWWAARIDALAPSGVTVKAVYDCKGAA